MLKKGILFQGLQGMKGGGHQDITYLFLYGISQEHTLPGKNPGYEKRMEGIPAGKSRQKHLSERGFLENAEERRKKVCQDRPWTGGGSAKL